MTEVDIRHGDCLKVLRDLPDNSVDSVVTDPPYGLSNTKPAQVADVLAAWVTGDTEAVPAAKGGFMGKDWDSFVPPPAVWAECLRVLKPGGHMAVFAGSRTQDLMGLSIRLAGFEIRDTLGWIYGSGFPKSMDVSKAIDKSNGNPLAFREFAAAYREAIAESGLTHSEIDKSLGIKSSSCYWARDDHRGGMPPRHHWEKVRDLVYVPEELERLYDEAEREVIGRSSSGIGTAFGDGQWAQGKAEEFDVTAPATDAAKRWEGWGTALKPAIEPILLARKPLVGTVAQNVLEHGVGGLNIDASRVGTSGGGTHCGNRDRHGKCLGHGDAGKSQSGATFHADESNGPAGRFPANVLLDEHAAKEMDQQSGVLSTSYRETRKAEKGGVLGWKAGATLGHADSGGASRFFPVFKYQAKAPKRERPVIERPPMLQLRDDLTPEQVDHVRARLQEAGIEIE